MDEIEQFDSEASEDRENPLLSEQPSIGVEQVGTDEFDFLDGISEVATLTSGKAL